jgi:hypothetical protein
MGKLKTQEDLFEFVPKLRLSKRAAFTQEGNLLQQFLYQRHYSGKYIREYVQSSLLCILTARSFKSFFDLRDAIRQLAYDYPHWEGRPAKAMLSFHLDKLLEIWQFVVSRKQLILQVYTYLRDSQAKDFYHESMAGALWTRIGNLPSPNGGNGGNGGGGPDVTWCGLVQPKGTASALSCSGANIMCVW